MQADRPLTAPPISAPPSPIMGGDCPSDIGSPSPKRSKPSADDTNATSSPCWQGSGNSSGDMAASSSSSSGESHSKSEKESMDIDPQKSSPAPPVFAFDPSTGCFIPKGTFDALPEELKVSTVSPNGKNKYGFPNYCLCCGLWFKRKHKCNRSNHPAAKGKYTFTLPADLLDTLRGWPSQSCCFL